MHIVVVGAGFAGLRVAQGIAQSAEHQVTIIDRHDYNFFPPLIYQVAAGFLAPSDISYPLRKFFANNNNVNYKQGVFHSVDTERKVITLSSGEVSYDKLVLAVGAETNYFGNKNIEKHALPMKRLSDALAIRNRLLQMFNEAAQLPANERAPYLKIVIAGGGPSGVELAGVLAEIRNHLFLKEYPEFRNNAGSIDLITADPSLLTPMSEKSQVYAKEKLEEYGINLLFSDPVLDYDGENITLASGKTMKSKTMIWTAGVMCRRIQGLEDDDFTRGNRIPVNEYLQLKNHPDIFAIGDISFCDHEEKYPRGYPQLGQVALSQGAYLGKYLAKQLSNQSIPSYVYKHRGDMAMVGRMKAVAEINDSVFDGAIAWFVWLWVHIIALVAPKNRVATTYNWMIAFFTKNQSMRMMINSEDAEQYLIKKKTNTEKV